MPSGKSVDEAGVRLQAGAESPLTGAIPTLDDESYVEDSESESYVEDSESESLLDDSEVELDLLAGGYPSSESEYESVEESDEASESEGAGIARIGVVTRKVQRGVPRVAFAQPIAEEARPITLASENDQEFTDDAEDRTGEWDLSESISEVDSLPSGDSAPPEPSRLPLSIAEGPPLIIEAEEAPSSTVLTEESSLADVASASSPVALGEGPPPAMFSPRSPEGLGSAQVKVQLGARREGAPKGDRDDFTVTVAQAEADAQSLEILGALDGLFEEDSFVEEDSNEEDEALREQELSLSDGHPSSQDAAPVDLGAVDEPIQALSGDGYDDEAEDKEVENLIGELDSAWDEVLEAQSLGTIEAVEAPEEALPQDDLDLDTFFEGGPSHQASEGTRNTQETEPPSLPFNQPSSEAKESFGDENDEPEGGRLALFALDLGEAITPNPEQMTPATDELARLPFYVEEQTQASASPLEEEDLADLAPADLELEIEPMMDPEPATPEPPESPPLLTQNQPEPPLPSSVSIDVPDEPEGEPDVFAMTEERDPPAALEDGPKPKGWVELDFELPADTILTPSKDAGPKVSQPPPTQDTTPKPPLNEVGLSIARLFGEEALTHAFTPEDGTAPGAYSEADIGLPEGWAAPPPPVDIEIDLDFDAELMGESSAAEDPISNALDTLEGSSPEVHIDPIQAALAELEGSSGFSPEDSSGRELDLDIPLAFLEGAPTLDSPKPLDLDAPGAPSPWDAPSETKAKGSRPPVSFGEEERPWWLPPEVEGEGAAEESAASTDVDDLWSAVWTTPSSANPPALPKGGRSGRSGIDDGDLPGLGEETPRLGGANPLGQRSPPPSNQRRGAAPDPLEAALKVVQSRRDDFKPQRRTLPPRRSIGRGRSPAPPPPSETAPLPEAPRARRSTRVSDRRQNARVVDVGGKVYFRRRGRIATGTLRDLSFSGCAVLTQSPLAPGAEVPLGLEVGGMRTIRVISRVVWCRQADPYGVEGESCMGVTFQHLEPEDRRLLSTFLSRVSL